MKQPHEMKLDLPMKVGDGMMSTTTKVWQVLVASYEGDLHRVKQLVNECPGLIYAQYNYTPPIHFAVREGHDELVRYLLSNGAYDPAYRNYPFLESLTVIANDRGYAEIESMLNEYAKDISKQKYHKGDNGEIMYNKPEIQLEFERAVDKGNLNGAGSILKEHPEFALDNTSFWAEGVLLFPAKENDRKMIDLLISYKATVPRILKWTQFYYFERYDGAGYMMEKGMSPNTMSWHHVTILHDMAQKGFIDKAELLLKYGADINPVDEEYLSTPLGMAARWGHEEMVRFLIDKGADVNRSGAVWSTPLAWARKKGHAVIEKILVDAGATN
jgi:uncharacterized protein